jgi:hypothetical protein
MTRQPGEADSPFLSADAVSVEVELRAYAARMAPAPSAAFVDRVVTAVERSPRPNAGWWARLGVAELVQPARRRLRVALAQVAGGGSIPLRLRLQAGAMLLSVALLITGGAVLAAAGANSVATWVAGPQAQATGARSSSPDLSPAPGDASTGSHDANGTTKPGAGNRPSQNPGNCGRPSQKPGNGNQPSQNPGNCGNPSQKPGGQPSDHPNATDNPGSGAGPGHSPGSQASNNPNKSGNPGDGSRPTGIPKSAATARR